MSFYFDLLATFNFGLLVVVLFLLYKLSKLLRQIKFRLNYIEARLKYIIKLLRKHVASVPIVTVTVPQPTYKHGDVVPVTGTVFIDTVPQVGTDVVVTLTDFAGTVTDVGTVQTDAAGTYTVSATVPFDAAPGAVTVTATALGVSVTATFTHNNCKITKNW